MDSEDLFLVAALLSAGALLRFILVLFGELITPNVLVAFYSIAIMLILPSFGEAIGIGLVSGIITALISQSLKNPAFLLSEPLGAAVCLLVFITLRYHKRAAPYAASLPRRSQAGLYLPCSHYLLPAAGFQRNLFIPAIAWPQWQW
jgi:hypothetical protein